MMLWTYVFGTSIIILASCAAQEEEDTPCVYLGDNSTWPKQLLDDVEACKKEPGEIKQDQTLNRKQMKNKKFLQKFWTKLLKRVSKEERAKILECLWLRQTFYDIENNEIDWDEVYSSIDSLKINSERKDSLKASIEECIEDNDEDELYKIKKMAKCFLKEKCTKAACPELSRRQRNKPLCKSKGYKKPSNDQRTTTDNKKPTTTDDKQLTTTDDNQPTTTDENRTGDEQGDEEQGNSEDQLTSPQPHLSTHTPSSNMDGNIHYDK